MKRPKIWLPVTLVSVVILAWIILVRDMGPVPTPTLTPQATDPTGRSTALPPLAPPSKASHQDDVVADHAEVEQLQRELKLAKLTCALKMNEWDCGKGLAFPSDQPAYQPAKVQQAMDAALRKCFSGEGSRYYLDCQEYPCVVFASGPGNLSLDDLTCGGSLQMGAVTTTDNQGDQFMISAAVAPAELWASEASTEQIQRRLNVRYRAGSETFLNQDEQRSLRAPDQDLQSTELSIKPADNTVTNLSAQIAAMPAQCAAKMEALGCAAPVAFDDVLAQLNDETDLSIYHPEQVREAVEEAEEQCPGLAGLQHQLDCSEFPCILFVLHPTELNPSTILCNDAYHSQQAVLKTESTPDGSRPLAVAQPLIPASAMQEPKMHEQISRRLDIRIREGLAQITSTSQPTAAP